MLGFGDMTDSLNQLSAQFGQILDVLKSIDSTLKSIDAKTPPLQEKSP